MARARELLFRIFYSTSYTLVFIILLAFIAASPIDTLYQSWRRKRRLDLALIAGTYVVTGLIALLIYASRLYTNRSVLNAIPKTYMPIDQDELPTKRVWRYVSDVTLRSAVIAYLTKPRSKRLELEHPEADDRIASALKPDHKKDPDVESIQPKWGHIEHKGWSSPAAQNLPNLEYRVVVQELTDLVEAKAVSLASADRTPAAVDGEMSSQDERVVEILQRPDGVGMREYITQLVKLGVITDSSVVMPFLSQYEKARFAPQPLTESAFQSLMSAFADVLRCVRPLHADLHDLEDYSSDDEQDDHDPSDALNRSRNLRPQPHQRSTTRSTLSDTGSVVRGGGPPARVSEDSVPSQTTDESEMERETQQGYDRAAGSAESILNSTQDSDRQRSDIAPAQPHSISTSSSHRPSQTTTRQSSRTNMSTSTSRRIVPTQRPTLRQQQSHASSILSSRSSKSHHSGRSVRSERSNNSTGSVVVRLNPDFATTTTTPATMTRNESQRGEVARTGDSHDDMLPYIIEMPSSISR